MKSFGTNVLRALPFLLVAMLGLGASPRVAGAARPASPSVYRKVVVDRAFSSYRSPASSPLATLSRLSPWRYRLKSLLEDTDPRGLQPADIGPAVMTEPGDISVGSTRRVACSRTLVPLRC